MRPITLEIEGLQSFNEKRGIDFETLGETGLFGIFGPTGSGKSTILDAITFALFGDVKRAKNGTQGIININCKTMRVSFTFELIKEGTRKRYRVERVSQKKKNSDNVSVIKIARLMELTGVGDVPICDKATDVTNKVTELIGLNQQDFTRAVVLPQNSFQEFMLMNNSDRRRMLERIFYLEEYGKLLADKLNRRIDRLKSCLDTLSGELRGYQDASDEALEEARKAMETAATEKEKAFKAFKKLELEFNQAKEIWQLVQEMTEVEERERHHASSAQEISEDKLKLDRAEKAKLLIGPIRKNKELTGRLQKASELLAAIESKLPVVRAELLRYQKSCESLKNERAVEQPKLVAQKARLEDALVLAEEIASVKKNLESLEDALTQLKNVMAQKASLIGQETEEYDRLVAEAAGLKKEWDTLMVDPEYRKSIQEGARLEDEGTGLKRTLTELKDDVELLKKRIGEAEARLEQTRGTIAIAQKEVESLTEEKARYDGMLREDRNTIQKKATEIQDIMGICRVMQLRQNQMEDLKSQVDTISQMLEETEKKNPSLLIAREEAAASCKKYKLQLEQTERMLDRDAACRLAKQLKEGVACPVCGSEHHPKPAVSADREELTDLESKAGEIRKRLEDALKALREAEAQLLVNGEQLKTARLQHEQAQKSLAAQSRDLEMERRKLPEAFRSLDPDNRVIELERLERELNSKMKELEDWEKIQSTLSQRLQKQNETLSEQKALESGILSELKLNRESLVKAERSVEETQMLWEANRERVSQVLAACSIPSIRAELERLTQNDERSNTLHRELDRINQQVVLKESRIGKLKEELQAVRDEAIKRKAEIMHLDNERKTREIRIHQLAGESNMEDEIKRIKDKLAEYETTERSLEEKIKILETDHQNLQRDHALLLNQKKTLAEDLQDDENRLKRALKDMDFADPDDVEKALLSDEEMNACKTRIEEYERAGIKILADKERLTKKLDSRTITEEGWKEINKAWQESSAARESLNSECDIADHHYKHIRSKHEKWLELTVKLEEANKRMSLLEQIRRLLGGNKGKDNSFIDYIAEERLRYVAARASETLGTMTRFKYALELDADHGFVIRDNANGGVYRMVTTLSGGETFLTSLSLALALSEQIQLKGQSPLEFFFLDEGFGTLDRSLLDNVTDSLERISKKERMIGLISHVPELRGRIGRRLMVEPPASDGEGTRVWIEKA